MAILVDYSQIAIASIMEFQDDLKNGTDEKVSGIVKHVILSSVLANKKKFSSEYGKVILCIDSKDVWRKDKFPQYKAKRKKSKEESGIDWAKVYQAMDSVTFALSEYFPYTVLKIPGCEADDIIGTMCDYFQENELAGNGLFDDPQPVIIVSSDGDHVQLQKHKNVKQWSPMQKKFVKPENTPEHFLIDKICTGDSGDGIPNIMSPDDIFLQEGVRQKSFFKKRLPEFYEKGIDACANDEERRNYTRNELLISYDHIPVDIRQRIVTTYKTHEVKGNKKKILEYLMAERMRNLLDHIEEF